MTIFEFSFAGNNDDDDDGDEFTVDDIDSIDDSISDLDQDELKELAKESKINIDTTADIESQRKQYLAALDDTFEKDDKPKTEDRKVIKNTEVEDEDTSFNFGANVKDKEVTPREVKPSSKEPEPLTIDEERKRLIEAYEFDGDSLEEATSKANEVYPPIEIKFDNTPLPPLKKLSKKEKKELRKESRSLIPPFRRQPKVVELTKPESDNPLFDYEPPKQTRKQISREEIAAKYENIPEPKPPKKKRAPKKKPTRKAGRLKRRVKSNVPKTRDPKKPYWNPTEEMWIHPRQAGLTSAPLSDSEIEESRMDVYNQYIQDNNITDTDLELPDDDYEFNSQTSNDGNYRMEPGDDWEPPVSSGMPPNEPPENPPITDEGESGDDDEEYIKKLQNLELQNQKRNFNREQSRKKKEQARKHALEKKRIQAEQKARRKELAEQTKVTTSDRIVRRLGMFSIGRSLGGSGQVMAAAAELFVFRPEEEAQAKEAEKKNAEIDTFGQDSIDHLETKKYKDGLDLEDAKNVFEDDWNKTKLDMENAKTPEEKQEILDEFKETILPTGRRKPGGSGGGHPFPSGPLPGHPPKGTTPPGGPGGGGGTTSPPPPPGGRRPTGPLPTGSSSIITTTGIILATAGALEVLGRVSVETTKHIAGIGNVLTQDARLSRTSVNAFNEAGDITKTGAFVAGAGAGGIAGGVISGGNPLGIALGAAIGGAGAKFITEPIVAAVTVGNEIMSNYADRSIAPMTLAANANQQILNTLHHMESNFRIDDITAEYINARGELSRAIMDMQESFIREWGPSITSIVRGLTTIVEFVGGGDSRVAGTSNKNIVDTLSEFFGVESSLTLFLSRLWENTDDQRSDMKKMVDALKVQTENNQLTTELTNFFDNQSQFFDKTGDTPFHNTLNFFTP